MPVDTRASLRVTIIDLVSRAVLLPPALSWQESTGSLNVIAE